MPTKRVAAAAASSSSSAATTTQQPSTNKRPRRQHQQQHRQTSSAAHDDASSFTDDDNDDDVVRPSTGRQRKSDPAVLQRELDALEMENHDLKMHLKMGKEELAMLAADSDERIQATLQLSSAVLRGNETEIKSLLKKFVIRFFPYGNDRVRVMRRYLEQLEMLMVPGAMTRVAMYCLCQDDEFFNSSREDSLWNLLMHEMNATEKQRDEVKSFRENAKDLSRGLRCTQMQLRTLKERVRRKDDALAEEMQELQNILTPSQFAKFVVWCGENQTASTTTTTTTTTSSSL